ncbi:MAG TPA: hypothetical protein VLX44_05455, partial [Xanthobacteraceae bacterium]|nr:hypothetical protein [Xanthobacteraceae bacterium]
MRARQLSAACAISTVLALAAASAWAQGPMQIVPAAPTAKPTQQAHPPGPKHVKPSTVRPAAVA